jgi:putative addiction module killer protein
VKARQREILICQDEDGEEPFLKWLNGLDPQTRGRVRVRIDRIEDGNFGDVRPVGDGLSELRLDFGPGYRIYFGQNGDEVHLICGGFKDSQPNDIRFAKEFWRAHG